MHKTILCIAAFYGGLAVVLGAFGAHALKARLDADALAAWHTAVQYQFTHALAMLLLGLLMFHIPSRALNVSGVTMAVGTALFSGSIYLLASRSLLPFGPMRFLGPVTPLGGLTLIVGWAALLTALLRATL
jgi:uncharacterized membrane protein YgdD (TMEM256/DUF423 family)